MAAELNNDYARKYDDFEIEKLSSDLLDWAETAKDIHICGWTRRYKKTKTWLNWLAETYSKFAEAKEEAMQLLGRKILNASFYGEGNATVGMAYLPIYDKDFREYLKWKSLLLKENTDEDREIIIRRAGDKNG